MSLLFRKLLFVFGLILLLFACKKEDELRENSDPETQIFLKKIDRSGENRLNTIVDMHWSGEDKDGYVIAYEISFDHINWSITYSQDTVFSFGIDNGSDTSDIDFYIRAIDNDGNKDKTPAYLKIPIKNTAPTISLDKNLIKGDSVFSVFSILWSANDVDGVETIDSVYIKINDANWFAVPNSYSMACIVPLTPEVNGLSEATVYLGQNTIGLADKIKGLIVGSTNKVYVKVKDQAGEESEIDSINPFFLRRKTSDFLVLDAYNVATTPNADIVYKDIISQVYGLFDYYDFYAQNKAYIPKIWNPTFSKFLSLYDKVFIYSDNSQIATPNGMIIEEAASTLQDYMNTGGKMLMMTDISNNAFPNNFDKLSALYQYSPIDSFQTFYAANQKATLPIDSLANPDPVDGVGYPILKVSHFMDAVDPFFPKTGANVIYRAQIRRANGVSNTKVIAAKTQNIQGKTNQVFFSAELFKMQADADDNGQQDELHKVFEKVLLDEFNW